MPDQPSPARIEARHERTESARLDNFVDGAFAFAITARVNLSVWTFCAAVGLLSTLIALAALPTGRMMLIPLAGFSYALLGFLGLITSGYRKKLEARLPA